MDRELDSVAKKLTETINGKGGISLEKVMRLLATPGGKRVLAALLSDGGQKIKRAATDAKNGNNKGIQEIIASISETEDGRAILQELLKDSDK
ncbi:MAG: hypothetical protein IJO61_05715 [Oscillospiraceae bacterium]|nr:hypothetical protein [Oscillospiraceae bacterium]MBQ6846611.1 hypothetical protein [Oscillospiraceae bacterium]MBQ7119052.1 hypothetical protein [Oscillospiraceae bacterium]